MTKSLAQVIADRREDARALERNLDKRVARILFSLLDDVEAAARDYLTMLPEAEAVLWSGRSATWLRGQFKQLAEAGNAEMRGRARFYRAICLPRKQRLADAYAQGKEAA